MKLDIHSFRRFCANRFLCPRLAYTHIFVQDKSMQSMIHVQNPFSFFWPDGNTRAKALVELRDEQGYLLSKLSRQIQPFGTLALAIDDLLYGLTEKPYFGSITVDLIPTLKYRRHLRKLTDGIPLIASPFWMRFFSSSGGSQGYSHSIDADRATVRGVPAILARYFTSKDAGFAWESSRSIDLDASSFAQGFVVNSSKETKALTISWRNLDEQIIIQKCCLLPSLGVLEISTPRGLADEVHLVVDPLPTPNAKPYVFVFQESGEFGFTHG